MIRAAILFLPFLLSVSRPNHAIYISIVDIYYNSTTIESSMEVKVFTDDLQDVIRNFSGDYVSTSIDEFVGENEKLIAEYFSEHLKLIINGVSSQCTLTKVERENDAHFLFFDLPLTLEWQALEVQGGFFTEVFPDQSNVVSVAYDEEKQFAKLTKAHPTYSFTFD